MSSITFAVCTSEQNKKKDKKKVFPRQFENARAFVHIDLGQIFLRSTLINRFDYFIILWLEIPFTMHGIPYELLHISEY